jgi:hypothetical protein
MNRERALKILLVLVGLALLAGIYPLVYLGESARPETGVTCKRRSSS